MSDTTQRDALQRNLCSRICDSRRTVDELAAVDAMLSVFNGEVDDDLITLLERDTYDASEGDVLDRAWRRGWNAAARHAIGVVKAHRGLLELRRQAYWPAQGDEWPGEHELGGES